MPELERKATLLEVKDIDAKQGVFTGYFSSFGTVDSYGDIVDFGAFAKTFKEWGPNGKGRIKCAYQHDPFSGLLGKPLLLEERSFGAYHETKVSQTSYGKDVLLLIQDGVLTEQSFAFETIQFVPKGKSPDGYRHLTELRVYEYGPQTWGANENTPITGVKASDLMERMARLDKHLKAGDLSDANMAALMAQTMTLWSKALADMPTAEQPQEREVIRVVSPVTPTKRESEVQGTMPKRRFKAMGAEGNGEQLSLTELMEQCITLAAQCVALMPKCFGSVETCLQCCSLCSQCCALCAKICAMMATSGMDPALVKQCCDLMVQCCELCQQCCEMCPDCVTDQAVVTECTNMMIQCTALCGQCKGLIEMAAPAASIVAPSGPSFEDKINVVYQAVRMIERIPYTSGDGDYARYWLSKTWDGACIIEDGKTGKYFLAPWTLGPDGAVIGALTEFTITFTPAMKAASVAQVMRAVTATAAKGREQKAGARNSNADAATIRDIHKAAQSLMEKPHMRKALAEDLASLDPDDLNTVMGLLDETQRALVLAACQPAAEPGKSHSAGTTGSGTATGPATGHPEVKSSAAERRRRELELMEMETQG